MECAGTGRFDGGVGVGAAPGPSVVFAAQLTSVSDLRIDVINVGTGDTQLFLQAGSIWSLGVDNSDSDKFKIAQNTALETNTRFTITTAGAITGGTYNGVTISTDASSMILDDVTNSQSLQVDTDVGIIDNTDGFYVYGGATPRQLTVTGGDWTLDQSVASGGAPTFAATNFSDGGSNIIPTSTQETNWDNHLSNNGTDHGYIDQDLQTSAIPQFAGLGIGIASPISIAHIYEDTASVNTTAGLTIEQDGAGDALLQFNLTAVRRWSMGIDNSSSDRFAIAHITEANKDTWDLAFSVLDIDITGNMTLNRVGYTGGGKFTTGSKVNSDIVVDVFEAQLSRGGAVGGVGLGLGYLFRLENGAGAIHDAGKFEYIWTDPADGAEDSKFIIKTMMAGSFVDALTIEEDTSLFAGKVKFTQTDGNEYIDSLNDGYMDYGATTAHRFNNDIVLPKTSGKGIKVDTTTPTFGWADLLGNVTVKSTGGTRPTHTAYNGTIDAFQFGDGDETSIEYHIPHDYVPGTDIYLHIHWSQTSATCTGGTIDFKYFAVCAKGHNQASGSAYTSTPITDTFSSIDINDGNSGLTQYQHHITEVVISGASATAELFDRDDLEPDGVIKLTLEMDSNNLTNSVTVLDPFISFVDIHYQTTNLIGTKGKAPDFYA